LKSKHAKYTTKNRISRLLVSRFLRALRDSIGTATPGWVLDAGSGEGLVMAGSRHRDSNLVLLDRDIAELHDARRNNPGASVIVGDVRALPFRENVFNLVLCTEVLEHTERPALAITELHRVCRDRFIFSVPREPLWRALNMLRFSYWKDWGNTPGHLNHWSKRTFVRELKRAAVIDRVLNPLPWTIVIGSVMKRQP
jgi:SAM-dependent methyltransferase